MKEQCDKFSMSRELWNKFSMSLDLTRQLAWSIRKTGDFGEAFSKFEKAISDASMKYHNAVFPKEGK